MFLLIVLPHIDSQFHKVCETVLSLTKQLLSSFSLILAIYHFLLTRVQFC